MHRQEEVYVRQHRAHTGGPRTSGPLGAKAQHVQRFLASLNEDLDPAEHAVVASWRSN